MNDQQKRALIYILEKGGETNVWYDVASPAVVKTMLDDGLIYQSDNRYTLTGKGKEVALEAWRFMTTDQTLIDTIVDQEAEAIRLQKQWRHNPLACPPLPRAVSEFRDLQWQEAISRGLHHKINRLIREKGEDW